MVDSAKLPVSLPLDWKKKKRCSETDDTRAFQLSRLLT